MTKLENELQRAQLERSEQLAKGRLKVQVDALKRAEDRELAARSWFTWMTLTSGFIACALLMLEHLWIGVAVSVLQLSVAVVGLSRVGRLGKIRSDLRGLRARVKARTAWQDWDEVEIQRELTSWRNLPD